MACDDERKIKEWMQQAHKFYVDPQWREETSSAYDVSDLKLDRLRCLLQHSVVDDQLISLKYWMLGPK